MSNHGKSFPRRVLEVFSSNCPNCSHERDIHWENGRCLGAVHDSHGAHVKWCDCTSLRQKEKQS